MIARSIAIACAMWAAGIELGLWGGVLVVVSAAAWTYAASVELATAYKLGRSALRDELRERGAP